VGFDDRFGAYIRILFDGPAVSALRRALVEIKQRWSVIGWMLSRVPPCFGRHVKPLVPDAFAVSTHQPTLGPVVVYGSFS
jgi:hypothetical protein